jgi:alpha-ketoglutarate-dependent taurine dioxygenase
VTDELSAQDLHPAFGSEVTGLDVNAPLDADTVRLLRALFDERGLVLVRQDGITLDAQRALAYALIGRDAPSADALPARLQEPFYVSNKENDAGAPFGRLLFHSDAMWEAHPFELLSLYAVRLEPPIIPTSFVSTVNAWRTLPDSLRSRVASLHVEHAQDATYARGDADEDVLVSTFDEERSIVTPVGHRHLRTGATMLYASQMMTTRVVELSTVDSEALLEELFAHLYRPENILEIEWLEGDLVLWDNIALQHARPNVSAQGPVRTLRKVFAPMPTLGASSTKPTQRTRAAG